LNKEQQKLFDYLPKPTISGTGKYEVEKTDK